MASNKATKSTSEGWWNDDMKDRLEAWAIITPMVLMTIALLASLVYLYMG